ncbi:sodium-dependent transporter [Lachnospiraceae bacterium ASD3451]|uniref:sodium-dependent transporter n=1 Tax=Diplocloster agilis TaxID=2850323 RepID=UPI001E00ED68|nr:sodium-dependent transporter [Diplocloster agilis]MBU9745491.1 sodium-dependent transporter [Diplocloster agilis]
MSRATGEKQNGTGNKNRWASKLGFILATTGAAIGLGNLWKFPYLMGKNGGFSFLAAYLFFICVLGLPVMITEMSLGRKTRHDPVQAYGDVHPHAKVVGVFGVLAAFIILSYYSVIGGWILKYFFSYATTLQAPADFEAFIGNAGEPVFWHFLFMLMTALICFFGVRGIEKASKFMMPALFVILLIIVVRSVTLPGASKGLEFMFSVRDSKFSIGSVNAALGQVFYSLSLCMGITITYGSYLSKKESIPKSCISVALLDTCMAVLAGVAIFPAVFSFQLEPGQGPSLIFGTLPKVFGAIKGGSIFALLFFLLVFFAAVTSAVALLEVTVSFLIDKWKWKRGWAVLIVAVLLFLLGIPSSLSYGVLSDFKILNYNFFDFVGMLTDNILLPVGGILMCYYIGWKWKPQYLVDEIEQEGVRFRLKKLWIFCIRFITPILVLIVTISGFVSIANVVMK